MPYCTQCGDQIGEKDAFCKSCGFDQEGETGIRRSEGDAGEGTSASPPETHRKKNNAGVEKKDGSDWIEIASALLLSVAMIATAWCAYQAARWSGVQTANYATANAARTDSVKAVNRSVQEILIDAYLFVNWFYAIRTEDAVYQEFMESMLSNQLGVAADAWMDTDPVHNPTAPETPFDMPEYSNEPMKESDALDEYAGVKVGEAKESNQNSDNYVLLSVLFATVLFFSGISAKFNTRWLSIGLLAMGWLVFFAASNFVCPWALSWLIKVTSTIASFTTMPARATIPKKEAKPKGLPVMRRPAITPTTESGIATIITNGWRSEPNWRVITVMISATPTMSALHKLAKAWSLSSFSPVNRML